MIALKSSIVFFFLVIFLSSFPQLHDSRIQNPSTLSLQDLNAVAEVPLEPESHETILAVGNAVVSCDTAANIITPTATPTTMAEGSGAAHPSTDFGVTSTNFDKPILVSSSTQTTKIDFEEAKIFLPEG